MNNITILLLSFMVLYIGYRIYLNYKIRSLQLNIEQAIIKSNELLKEREKLIKELKK